MKGNITVNKKAFTADYIEAPNNTDANVTATNNANNNSFDRKKFSKIMHHLLSASQRLIV